MKTRERSSRQRRSNGLYLLLGLSVMLILAACGQGDEASLDLTKKKGQADFSVLTIAEELGVKTDQRPMAVGVRDADAGRTFVAWMGENSHPFVQAYDETTQVWQAPKQVGNSPNPDSHHYPTIVQAADGRLLVFYGAHNDTPLRLARSPEVASIDGEWEDGEIPEADFASYPMPLVSENGDIYVFYRETSDRVDESLSNDVRPLLYVKSTDNGETWENSQTLTGERYAIGSLNRPDNLDEIYVGQITYEPAKGNRAERFHLVWTIAGGGAGEEPRHDRYHRNLYYAYFEPGNERFYSADGTDLGVQIDNDEMENDAKAVDTGEPKYARGSEGFPGHDVGYTHTVQLRRNGDPLLIFNTQAGANGETKVIEVAQWRGNKWKRSVVAENQGLLDLETTGPNAFRLYLAAREKPGIQTYTAKSSGKFKKETFIDTPTPVQRAVVIKNYKDPFRLLVTGNSDISDQRVADRNIYVAGVGNMSGVTVEDPPPPPPPSDEKQFIEAESAADQTAFAPFLVVEDPEASGGSYITTDEDLGNSNESAPADGQATYDVTIDGTVAIWLRVNFANNGANSFWLRSNDDSFTKFDEFDAPEGWIWVKWTEKSNVDSISVARREDGAKLDQILVTADLFFEPESPPPDNEEQIIEAESAADQAAFAPFLVAEDAEASVDGYITTDEALGDSNDSAPSDGVATYEVEVDGTVAVWLRVNFANNGSNSFWIRGDDDAFAKFDDFDPPEGWYWLKWTEASNISSISVARREDGTSLDKILITSDLSLEPQ